MTGITEAVSSLRPNSSFGVRGKILIWNDPVNVQPTQSEIDAEIIRLQAEYDAQEYARNRELEYPTVQALTVALYDTDDKAAIETKRAAVKTKWPKDNSGPV